MRAWNPSSSVAAVTRNWPSCSNWMRIPWPADERNCWRRRWSGNGSVNPAGAASRWKKTPQVIAQIERLLEHDTAGDPMSIRKWTHKTTAKVAGQLQRLGIRIGARTVARLLDKLHFSLRVNRKKIAFGKRSIRDQQFRHINRLRL